ncbi:hypothetical protein [Tenacibaculum sp. M341]|uniref:hypothetical protein n=1 Tax=Tenacibaculum sp. M341 TaxID=2530339 RepID=UPI0014055830|nr:hypothetical protein [Tenacibaculum sp. M341]
MKQGPEDFKVLKKNAEKRDRNYIFQNNKITRVGFYIVLTCILIGISMVVVSGVYQ